MLRIFVERLNFHLHLILISIYWFWSSGGSGTILQSFLRIKICAFLNEDNSCLVALYKGYNLHILLLGCKGNFVGLDFLLSCITFSVFSHKLSSWSDKVLIHSHSFVSFKENTCLYICLICVKNERLQYIEIIFKRFIPLVYLF